MLRRRAVTLAAAPRGKDGLEMRSGGSPLAGFGLVPLKMIWATGIVRHDGESSPSGTSAAVGGAARALVV